MMAENPNWRWSLNNGSSSSLALDNSADDDDLLHNHGYPVSWTQLLVGGLASCDSNLEYNKMQVDDQKKHCISDNETVLISHVHNYISDKAVSDSSYHPVKQETIEHYKHHQQHKQLYDHTYNHYTDDDTSSWSSCFKSLSSTENSHVTTYMDFSSDHRKRNQDGQVLLGDQSVSHHKCKDSSEPSGTPKKARVQPSSTHKPALKVKKERLGDRITALHQLVSPFGKTDTASVLLEAMGYIRFLEGQIQALTAPYSGNASSAGSVRIQQSVNEDELSAAAAAAGKQDLRSRGLSLVSVDWAHQVNNTIGILDINNNNNNNNNNNKSRSADYWASSAL